MPVMLPADSMFLIGESREHPMHVGGLQLFRKPAGAGPDYVGERLPRAADPHRGAAAAAAAPGRPREQPRAAVVDRRARHRPRVPRAAVRAAATRQGAAAARAGVAAARHPARPAPADVGVPPHRRARGRPVRHLHEDPPLARRRRGGDVAAGQHDVDRPRGARCAPGLGEAARQPLRTTPGPLEGSHRTAQHRGEGCPGRRARRRRRGRRGDPPGRQGRAPRLRRTAVPGAGHHAERADHRWAAVRRRLVADRPAARRRRRASAPP